MEANRINREREHEEETHLEKTRFNARISSHRVTDTLVMELPRIKKIREAVGGATINDVIISVVGGALHKYLDAKDELPEASLKCGAPINVRAERNSESAGNQVGFMTIDMATDIADPVERLRSVMEHSSHAKETSSVVGQGVMMDISQGLWPQFMKATMLAATFAGVRGNVPLPIHTVVSNVPGPQFPLYLAGARVQWMMGMGPLLDLAGLFHAVISCNGKITINFVSCRELLPDPDFYKQCLAEAYDELESSALALNKPARKTTRRRRKRA
jgi:WS/DGAT/MGAT family acyltransferase